MPGKQNKVEVTILDDVYVLKGFESGEYMEMLAFQLNKRLRQAQSMNSRLNNLQTAILTSLNLLDELTKLQQENQVLNNRLEEQKEKARK